MTRQVNLLQYLRTMAVHLLIWGTMVHEYGHLIALRLMGLHGEIRSSGLNLTWLTNGASQTQLTLWRFSGGLLQAIYGLYLMWDESDNETWLAGLTVASQGIVYAFYEAANMMILGSLFSVLFTFIFILYLVSFKRIKFD